jgi:hypothetical protein
MPSSYFPLDVNFFDHPKVMPLGDLTLRMHLSAIGYANRLMTDGFIAAPVPGRLVEWDHYDTDAPTPQSCTAELVRAVLWHRADEPCPRGHDDTCPKLSGDGWRIHDFLDHNRSKEERERSQEQERERKAAWREKQRQTKRRPRLSAVPGDAHVPRDSTVRGTRDTRIPGTSRRRLTETETETRSSTHPEELSPPAGHPQASVDNPSTSRRQPRRAKLVEPQPIGEAVAAIAGGRRPPAPAADQRRWREEQRNRDAADRLLAEGNTA